MFGKHTDYHGSRGYKVEKPQSGVPGQVGLRISLIVAWAKLQIEKFLRSGAATSKTTWLIRGNEKYFTLLGEKPDGRFSDRPITDIFPTAGAGARRENSGKNP